MAEPPQLGGEEEDLDLHPLERASSSQTALPLGITNSLAFGIVRQLGSDIKPLRELLENQLSADLFGERGYTVARVKLSTVIGQLAGIDRVGPDADAVQKLARLERLMDVGDSMRAAAGRGDAVLLASLRELVRDPLSTLDFLTSPPDVFEYSSCVIIFESLMHPDEVQLLRDLWGPRAFIIATSEARTRRRNALLYRFDTMGRYGAPGDAALLKLTELLARDEKKSTSSAKVASQFQLSVGDTYYKADLFAALRSTTRANRRAVSRLEDASGERCIAFLEAIFGDPFATPTQKEFGMRVAHVAAECSSAMARRVGAVVMSSAGQLKAVGFNEVPKAGGGVYWAGDDPDYRSFRVQDPREDEFGRRIQELSGSDRSVHLRNVAFSQIVERATIAILLRLKNPEAVDQFIEHFEELISELLVDQHVLDSEFFDSTEYHVELHAEMMAITDAARRGISLAGDTLYTTTYPCHQCVRQIIASGITHIVYQEPYPKSKANTLFAHDVAESAMEEDFPPGKVRVLIEQFVGIAPASISKLMSFERRMLRPEERPADSRRVGMRVEWRPTPGVLRRSLVQQSSISELWHALRFGGSLEVEAILERLLAN